MQTNITKRVAKTYSGFKSIPFVPRIIDSQLKVYTFFLNPLVYDKMISLVKVLKSREGISTDYHQYGGLEFVYENKEIGHLHSDGLLDLQVTGEIAQKYLNHESIEPHHIFGVSTWISIPIHKSIDLRVVYSIVEETMAYLDLEGIS